MKNLKTLIPLLLFVPFYTSAQITVPIYNLEMPAAPALTLLDQSTTNIETPKNIQALTTTLINNIHNDIGLEISPYMIFNNHKNFYEFYGVKWDAKNSALVPQNWFKSVIKDLSVSFAKVKKEESNSLSIGIRTNLIRVVGNERKFIAAFNKMEALFTKITANPEEIDMKYNIDQYKTLRNVDINNNVLFDKIFIQMKEGDFVTVNDDFDQQNESAAGTKFRQDNQITQAQWNAIQSQREGTETIWQIIQRFKTYGKIAALKDTEIKNFYKKENAFRKEFAANLKLQQDDIPKPLFTIDVAAAYSHFYPSDSYSEGQMGKLGVWSNLGLNLKLSDQSNHEYLSVYGYGRYIRDNTYVDPITLQFTNTDYFDLGGKAEFEYGKLTFAYEYIKRSIEADNYRSVGSIKFKFNETITLNGGFGKNFEKTDNLVSFLGINWGIENNNKFSVQKK